MELVTFRSPDPRAYLACDELLLDQAEEGLRAESLRFGVVEQPAVVMGVGAIWRRQVRAEECAVDGVPVLRRCSGGGAVLVGHGCLTYSAVLDMRKRPELRSVRGSCRHLVAPLASALSRAGVQIRHAGLCDLAWDDRKVGGTAQKRKRRWLLHHGTLLYGLEVEALDRYLAVPPDMPDYRCGRPHSAFVRDLPYSPKSLIRAVCSIFGLDLRGPPLDLSDELADEVAALIERKHGTDEWVYRR